MKRAKDKTTIQLFYENILRPAAKVIAVCGTVLFRTLRDLIWFTAGILIVNSQITTPLEFSNGLLYFMMAGVGLYNYFVVSRSVKYT